MNLVVAGVFMAVYVAAGVVGVRAYRWRRSADAHAQGDWALGGRRFGGWPAWFLLGGDVYTASTFIAVPALVFGTGALGYFPVANVVLIYPIAYLFIPRLWSLARRHGHMTTADGVHARYGTRALTVAIAATSLVAVMPYIGVQLAALETLLVAMGIGSSSPSRWYLNPPLIIAFLVIVGVTYVSGIRAPTLIAFAKDTLLYVVIVVAVVYIPYRLGGWNTIFASAGHRLAMTNPKTGHPYGGILLRQGTYLTYASLALGTGASIFLYPHTVTGVLASSSRRVVRRNLAVLPMYSLLLGMIALLGFAALAAGVKPAGGNAQLAVPQLFQVEFPGWFVGLIFGVIGIGALVPASIMAIGAANIVTRNLLPEVTGDGRAMRALSVRDRASRIASLLVITGALIFVVAFNPAFILNLQLLGGIWILQTAPVVWGGLYTRWLHRWALLAGWAAGMGCGTFWAYQVPAAGRPGSHFGGSVAQVPWIHQSAYIGVTALAVNLGVTMVMTPVFRLLGLSNGVDSTNASDYTADDDAAASDSAVG